MSRYDETVSVTIEVARVEALARSATMAGDVVAALSFTALQPSTTSSDTLSSLAACVGPATTTAQGVGIRFDRCGQAVAVAAARLRGADVLELRVA